MWQIFMRLLIAITATLQDDGKIVPIAHLLPAGEKTKLEPAVLALCARHLKEKNILPPNMTLRVHTLESCNQFSGIENAALLHYRYNASVFFGPGCNEEMLVIGKLAPHWNAPVIAHLSGADALADRSIYKTMGSVALTSATEMARAVITLIEYYGWRQIGTVQSTVDFTSSSLYSLKQLIARQDNIQLNVAIEIDPSSSVDEILSSSKLDRLTSNARIIICELGKDIAKSVNFMLAVMRAGLKNEEFVFIFPWLAHLYEHRPWEANVPNAAEIREAFNNVIFVSAHGYDQKFVNNFQNILSKETTAQYSYFSTIIYMCLYDALYLYALALSDAYRETQDEEIYKNGHLIWRKMTRKRFDGMTGQVLINDQALRLPNYGVYHVSNGNVKIVIELAAQLPLQCSKRITADCFSEQIVKEVLTYYWNSSSGVLPGDYPECGFRRELCDYTPFFIAAAVVIVLLTASITAVFIVRYLKERRLYDMIWRIPREDLYISERHRKSETSKSQRTLLGSSFLGSDMKDASNTDTLNVDRYMCNGVLLAGKKYMQSRSISFTKQELLLLKEMKLLEHGNLNKFYGISYNQQNSFIVLWTLCQRGSLEDILFNDDLKLGSNFLCSFAMDVVKGLCYLHGSDVVAHGFLCLQTCMVDSNWNIRLSNFGTEVLIHDRLRRNELRFCHDDDENNGNEKNEKTAEGKANSNVKEKETSQVQNANDVQLSNEHFLKGYLLSIADFEYLQQAPEVIRVILNTAFLPPASQPADIYSLGMVLYQILFRVEVFSDTNCTRRGLLEQIASFTEGGSLRRPQVPGEGSYDDQLITAIESCWSEDPLLRPTAKKMKSIVTPYLTISGSGGSLVDQMMKMMEEYTQNLEVQVRERTALLEEAQRQSERLLNNMLPKSVAEQLKVGKPIKPQVYPCATVLFSDIPDFLLIAGSSTPAQLINFLNAVFEGFDAIIAQHDAYKVETIGDAYMVVSGVPHENGNAHIHQIASIALKLRKYFNSFKLEHRPEHELVIQIGFHSGSVAAGVVGLSAPRYCLFGDTVNMASRMESTGVRNKIQISENSASLLRCFFPQFHVVERGKIPVKGKGECLTYFLEAMDEPNETSS